MIAKRGLTRDQQQRLHNAQMATGAKASQSRYVCLKDRLKLIRMESVGIYPVVKLK